MNAKKETGFTLVELMVVIVLIGLLAGVVGVKVVPIIFKGKTTAAQSQMKEIEKALSLFYMEESRYPEELSELTQTAPGWPEGYIQEIRQDPWGEEYMYVVEASRSGSTYRLWSKGEDRLDGTEDDVTLEEKRDQ